MHIKIATDSSKYLKSVLVQGMADENAVNESWGCISEEYSTMADTLKAIYRWVGTNFVRDEYARLASEEVQNVKYILRELERVAYESLLSHER